MIRTVQIVWQEGPAHIEERSGMFWCYLDGQHVGTQLYLDAAIKLAKRKAAETTQPPDSSEG